VIASRPVASIATKDCVLFLWTTNQHLRIAHGVLEAWGFEYKSNYVWGKDKASTGRWNRSRHEILLIGTRGDVPCPAPGEQWDSLIMAPRGAHSAKPKCFLEMIEQYFPNVPKIELNCRGAPRPGWEAWGNEVEADASAHRVLNAKSVGTLTPDQVYVGRVFRPRFPLGSKWGNKFEIPRDGTRAEVIEKYRAWIGTQPALMAALEELRGKDLVCWCAPLPCHADVLLELANREAPGPDPVAAADLAASAGRSTP
jgi:N6-adenosine-specific RNA methylase IME4